MISIKANDLRLAYHVREKLTLRPRDKRLPQQTGGTISGSGRHRFVTALDGVSFELEAGDRLGLVGANGAGKTTLLKVLYGIYEPTAGKLDIKGRVDALFNISIGFRPSQHSAARPDQRLDRGPDRRPYRGDHRVFRTRRVHRHAVP